MGTTNRFVGLSNDLGLTFGTPITLHCITGGDDNTASGGEATVSGGDGFLSNLLARLRRDKSEGAGC